MDELFFPRTHTLISTVYRPISYIYT